MSGDSKQTAQNDFTCIESMQVSSVQTSTGHGQQSKMTRHQEVSLDQGWSWVVAFAAFFVSFIVDGTITTFGILLPEYSQEFNTGVDVLAWIGGLVQAFFHIAGPMASIMSNKCGFRFTTMIGGIILSASLLASSGSRSTPVMMLTYGFFAGCGFGLLYIPSLVVVSFYFEKYRSLATGIMLCGTSVGVIVYPPLTTALIQIYGWRSALWVIAAISLNGVVAGATFWPTVKSKSMKSQKMLDASLFLQPVFLLLSLSATIAVLGFYIPITYVPAVAQGKGYSPQMASLLMSMTGVASAIGRPLFGCIADRTAVDAVKLYCALHIFSGVLLIIFPLFSAYWVLGLFTTAFGIMFASHHTLFPVVCFQTYGLHKYGDVMGLTFAARGVGSTVGIVLAGYLRQSSGNFNSAFYVAGAAFSVSGFVLLPLHCLKQSSTNKDAPHSNLKESNSTSIHI